MHSPLFTLLRGSWDFTRVILAARAEPLSVRGSAAFTPEGAASLRYTERGVLQAAAAGPPLDVRAEHEWRFPPAAEPAAGDSASVYFPDGRFFHAVALPPPAAAGEREARFTHQCDPDTYEGSLALDAGGARMRLRWRVTGPRKDSTIETHFVKRAEGAGAAADEGRGGGGGGGAPAGACPSGC